MLSTNSYFDRVPAQEILVDNAGTKYDIYWQQRIRVWRWFTLIQASQLK
jgi:hypothetical protein